MDERILDEQRRLVAAARDVNAEHPQLLLANVGPSCLQFLSLLLARLGPEWRCVGKTARDQGKVTPPGFLPRRVTYRGREHEVVGVSHDALFWVPELPVDGFPDGAQFDVIASANWWDVPYLENGRRVAASVRGAVIPEHEYRDHNPPVDLGASAPAPAPQIPPQPRAIEFPPRDLALEALRALDAFYRDRGRPGAAFTRADVEQVARGYANQGPEPTASVEDYVIALGPREAVHVDHEGLAVWFGDYLRRYATGDHAPATSDARERHAASLAQVLADVSRAWPK